MKQSTCACAAIALVPAAYSQLTFDNQTETFDCNPANGSFCAGASQTTNIIVRCVGGKGVAGNCNDNLAGVPPIGIKITAQCWQTSTTSGDAACSVDGTVYASNGSSFAIPASLPGSSEWLTSSTPATVTVALPSACDTTSSITSSLVTGGSITTTLTPGPLGSANTSAVSMSIVVPSTTTVASGSTPSSTSSGVMLATGAATLYRRAGGDAIAALLGLAAFVL